MKPVHFALVAASGLVLLIAAGGVGPNAASIVAPSSSGGLVTMWALDGISNTLNLLTGEPGHVEQDHEVRNANSHLDFGNYFPGEFTVSIQGGDAGGIVDIGSEKALQDQYGYGETVGGGRGFASLHVEQDAFVVRGGALGPEADAVLSAHGINEHVPIVLDHIYVVRIVRTDDAKAEIVVKLHVVDFQPGRSVTVRWERLSR